LHCQIDIPEAKEYFEGQKIDGMELIVSTLDRTLHCVQKKTPTHSFFHISMNDV